MSIRIDINALDGLEFWDSPHVQVPERSRLYHLAAIGVSTPYVECFTSYLSRLAAIHHVTLGSLISKEIKRLLPKNSTGSGDYNFSAIYPSARVFNGLGRMAECWVRVLEQLTLRQDLNLLTMLKWREVLSSYGLMRPTRSWCPDCYREWDETGQTIYEPLIWTIKMIEVCVRHNRRLTGHCPFCRKSLPFLGNYYRVGHCSRCMKWLGNPSKKFASANSVYQQGEPEWQKWIATNIGELLALPAELSPPSKDRVAKTLTTLARKSPRQTVRGFAQWLQMPFPEVHRWCNGERLPQLSSILRMCHRVGITLVEFFMDENFIVKIDEPRGTLYTPLKIKKGRGRSPHLKVIKRKLEEILNNDELPPLSMLAAERQLKVKCNVLRRHFPELCRGISAKYKQYKQDYRLNIINLICDEVKSIVLGLHAEGLKPTQLRIRQHMSKSGYLRIEQVQHAIITVKRELGYQDA